VPEDGAAGIDGDAAPVALAGGTVVGELVDEVLDELDELHAAAVNASGIRAAAVQTTRILLATGAYSFTSFTQCTLTRAVASSHAGAGEQGTASEREEYPSNRTGR
jgi:hypothetical protein